jgi:hypothetical protein
MSPEPLAAHAKDPPGVCLEGPGRDHVCGHPGALPEIIRAAESAPQRDGRLASQAASASRSLGWTGTVRYFSPLANEVQHALAGAQAHVGNVQDADLRDAGASVQRQQRDITVTGARPVRSTARR